MAEIIAVRKRVEPLPALTGVRGIAAMCVFLCHLQPITLALFGFDPNSGSQFIGNGFRGVDLFFVLSGFILFHVHSGDFREMDAGRIWQFYVIRFFRVYPLNAVIILVMLPLPLFFPQFVEWHRLAHLGQGSYHLRDFTAAAFFQSLFLAQQWTFAKLGTWNEPAWTLSAEVVGYCFFPALAMVACRQIAGLHAGILAVASLTLFVLLMVAGGHATSNPSGAFGLVRMTFCFVAGVYLCRLFQLRSIPAAPVTALTIASVVLIGLCFWWSAIGTLSVFGFAGLILGLAYKTGPIHGLIVTRPVMFLGRVSFSFYIVHLIPLELFHYFVLDTARQSAVAIRLMALAAVVTAIFLLAVLTYRCIEIPFQRLGRRVAARLPPASSIRETVA